jgi:outer membrane receptor protein involved in Fe transport
MKTISVMRRLLVGASLAALSTHAFAQEAAEPNANAVEEVVVTGSRIVRNGNNAPTPVTVATVEALQTNTPSNIPDALNKLPAFAGSRGQATLGAGSAPNQGNYLNLRGFGVERTLILMDGRRVPSTNAAGNVDTNTLPQMLIQRVDVVTGGASAVYGSDAVTGVVNFVLDKKFTGLKGVVQGGVSSRGDNNSWRGGLAGGSDIFDRGHVIWSVEHYQSDGIKSKYDRPLGDGIYQEAGAGTAANPFHIVKNGRVSNTSFGGLILNGPLAGQMFMPGGALATFNPGTPTGNTNLASGGDGGYVQGNTLLARLRTDQAFGRFEYQLSDDVTGFMQVAAAESRVVYRGRNVSRGAAGTANAITIYSGNAFLPASVQSALTATNTASFNLGRYDKDFGQLAEIDALTDGLQTTVGLQGKFKDRWNWETYYTHGEGRVRMPTRYNVNNPRFYAAIDAVKDGGGNIVCRVTLTNPGLYPGCVPMNIFGDGTPSAAAIKYVLGTTQFQTINKMDDAAFNVTGDLFNTWAGPVSVAAGYEYRSQSMVQTTNANPQTAIDTTGLRGFNSNTQAWTQNIVAPTQGSNSVWEANIEAVVPLLKDVALVKNLEFNGAFRYTDYSTSGVAKTWKLGLNYSPIDDVRFRLVRSRDIRAPTLNDLYGGQTIALTGYTDLHTGVAGFVNGSSQGNPNLLPEVADNEVAGVVYQPHWLPGFSISLDYYNIVINNAIGSVGGNNTATQQECERSGGTSILCSLYIRPNGFSDRSAANYPTMILTQSLNIAKTYTHGVDLEASYNFNLEDIHSPVPGSLDLRMLLSNQPVLKSRALPSAVTLNQAGAASLGPGSVAPAKYRLNFSANYRLENFQAGVSIRYWSSLKPSSNPTLVYSDPNIPAITYVDMNLSYDLTYANHKATAFVSVANLFDKDPPVYASTSFTGNPGFFYPTPTGYDVVGRYFTTGLRFKF